MNCPYCSCNEIDLIAETKYKTVYKCPVCKGFTESEPAKKELKLGALNKNLISKPISQQEVTETSKLSYKQIKGLETSQIRQVLAYINAHPKACIAEVASGLRLQKSSISARMNKLKAKGQITYSGRKKYPAHLETAREVETWSVT